MIQGGQLKVFCTETSIWEEANPDTTLPLCGAFACDPSSCGSQGELVGCELEPQGSKYGFTAFRVSAVCQHQETLFKMPGSGGTIFAPT